MLVQRIGEDSLVLDVDIKRCDLRPSPQLESECVSRVKAFGKSRGASERDLIPSSDGGPLVGFYGKGRNALFCIKRLPLGKDTLGHD
jgi:hypothetical protein